MTAKEDLTACPSCGERGEPQHDVDRVTLWACKEFDCSQDEMWEVPRNSIEKEKENL